MLAIFTINALAFGWIGAIWSKSGALNIMIATVFICLTVLNCTFAARYF